MTQECKKCKRRFKVLVKGACHNCNPEAWAGYFKKLYNVKGERP